MLGRMLMAGVAAIILSSATPALAQFGYAPPPPPPRGPPPGPPPGPPIGPGGGGYEDVRRLRYACDQGDRRACIRFGMILGEHQEYRRTHPEFYSWDR